MCNELEVEMGVARAMAAAFVEGAWTSDLSPAVPSGPQL